MDENRIIQIVEKVMSNRQFTMARTSYHTHNRADSQPVDFTSLSSRSRFIAYRLIEPSTAVAVALAGGSFVMPFSGSLTSAFVTVDTAGVTGSMTVDILRNGTSIFGTNVLSIQTGDTNSQDSPVQPVILGQAFQQGDIFTFSVLSIQGTPALGLSAYMRANETST